MRLANHLIEFLVRRSTKKHSILVRAIATLLGVLLFVAGIPAIFFCAGKFLYRASILPHRLSQTVSIVCFIIGLPWVLSAVFLQLFRGKGTPVPIVPTKHFLKNGPYRYVRNPMILGFFLYLLAWAFLFNKGGAFMAAAVIIALLLIEIKFIEEPELEKRFGDAYREYKKETPFIFPKWRKRKQGELKGAINVNTNQYHIHLSKVQPLAGFAAADIPPKAFGWILARAFVCSDDPAFYLYCDQISKMFLNRYFIDAITHYLILIHSDLSADVYVNKIPIQIEILSKRPVKAGELISQNDIANIRRMRFPGIEIKEDNCVIFCFKKGWKFGLFFDFSPADRKSTLDVERLSHDLGSYYRYLTFQELYSILENEPLFEQMFTDGWFPFIQLLGADFEDLAKSYKRKANLSSDLSVFLSKFDRKRIYSFVDRWWENPLFGNKKKILEAGIDAYLSATDAGYITCVKTLYSEIEGIIRIKYVEEKKKTLNFAELVEYVKQKAEGKFGSRQSLGFSDVFYRYLNETVFKNFDLTTGQVDLSRHSVSHGVADQTMYTRIKAIQAILTIDQMYFYLT